jgi:hypothetical protein
MGLTVALLTLKLLHVYIQPANASDKDDRKLAACIVEQMKERPSELVIVQAKDEADAVLTVENQAKFRIHVVGTLRKADGSLLADRNHITHSMNHGLCHQAEGLLEELAEQLSKR